jgi:hypothetical protein
MYASAGGHTEAIKALAELGADTSSLPEDQKAALLTTAKTTDDGKAANDRADQQAAVSYSPVLAEALRSGSRPFNCAKGMLVGEGRAGKTSTMRALLGQPFNEDEQSTSLASTEVCTVERQLASEWRPIELGLLGMRDEHTKAIALCLSELELSDEERQLFDDPLSSERLGAADARRADEGRRHGCCARRAGAQAEGGGGEGGGGGGGCGGHKGGEGDKGDEGNEGDKDGQGDDVGKGSRDRCYNAGRGDVSRGSRSDGGNEAAGHEGCGEAGA